MKGATAHIYTQVTARDRSKGRGDTHTPPSRLAGPCLRYAPAGPASARGALRPRARPVTPVDVRTYLLRPAAALKSSATGRPLCADAGAPAGLVQLEHLYTPGNCAGDAASVPSWIFSGQLAKSVRNVGGPQRRRRGANPPRLAHGRAASPVPHRPMSTALSAPASPLEAHTPVHVIGWERVDADTDTGNDRHAYQPPGRPRTPNPHRSLSNRASSTRLSAHPSERRPRPED